MTEEVRARMSRNPPSPPSAARPGNGAGPQVRRYFPAASVTRRHRTRAPDDPDVSAFPVPATQIRHRTLLAGPINEYRQAA